MRRTVILASIVVAAALTAIGVALAGGQGSSSSTGPAKPAAAQAPTVATGATLRASVGPGFTVNVKRNGKKVSRIKAGTYRVVVSDLSSEHNLAVKRANGTARALTTVAFTGTKTVSLRLTTGRWEFFCVPHEPVMRQFVAVGAAAPRTAAAAAAATTTTVAGDDRGGHGEAEPGDDRGGHGEAEPGDDRDGDSGHGVSSGHGGGDD
jgi:hypothetical protein